jgi:hypothetical protein
LKKFEQTGSSLEEWWKKKKRKKTKKLSTDEAQMKTTRLFGRSRRNGESTIILHKERLVCRCMATGTDQNTLLAGPATGTRASNMLFEV